MARTSIIVTSGSAAEVTASVASALDQTDGDLEVVVVGSGADDALQDGVAAGGGSGDRFADDRIRRVASAERDFATQVNRALATVRAPFVKLLPAGDRLAPGCLAAETAALDARSDAGIVFAAVECVDEDGRPVASDPSFETHARTGEELLPDLLGDLRLAAAAALVRRPVLLDAGGLDPLYAWASVHDLWLRVLATNPAVLLGERLARVRVPVADEGELAERALAALRALDRSGRSRFLSSAGDALDRPAEERASARLRIVDAIVASRNQALLFLVPDLVAAARALGARVGTARSERLAAAGLTGLSQAGRSGRSGGERFAGVASPLAHADAEVRSDAAATPEEIGTTLSVLRSRRRLLASLAAGMAVETTAAARIADLAEASRRRVAAAPEPEARGSAGGSAAARILAESDRTALAAERLLEKLGLGSRLHGAARAGGGVAAESVPVDRIAGSPGGSGGASE